MKKLLITLTLLANALMAHAQSGWCGFTDELQHAMQDTQGFANFDNYFTGGLTRFRSLEGQTHLPNPIPPCPNCLITGSGCPKATYVLPIVVHIVHLPGDTNPGTRSNITDAQVNNAIEKLNAAFRNAAIAQAPAVNSGIQFCLAKVDYSGSPFSGILRYSSSLSDMRDDYKSNVLALGQNYSPQKYINIYVVNHLLDSFGVFVGKLGTSTRPGVGNTLEGIIVAHDFFGSYPDIGSPLDTNSLGLVLPHEMGHYLGLYHPFDFGCSGITSATCATQGDKCCDVPAVNGKHQDCSVPWNTCTTENYGGVDPNDQKENYMDYSNESCKNTFTADQVTLMHFALQRFRPGLWNAQNVNYLQLSCCVLSAQFSGEDFMCNNSSTILTAYRYSTSVTYKWRFYQGTTLVKTFTRSLDTLTVQGLSVGTYTVTLTVDDGSDSIMFSRKNWFTVGNCSQRLKSNASNWFFGNYAGVRFYQAGTYRDIQYLEEQKLNSNQVNPGEGTLSISNSNGRLLFYGGTNYSNPYTYRADFKLYDSTYSEMAGSPLTAWDDATEPAISFPMADSSGLYWVVSNAYDSLIQNIVNMNLTSTTKGEVTLKNKRIIIPSWLASSSTKFMESLTAIPHCNGKDHWVLAQVLRGDTTMILVFNAKKTGITYHSRIIASQAEIQTNMKASPDGRWVALEQEIFLFDKNKGTLKSYARPSISQTSVLSVVFSPNSKVLYRYERRFPTPYFFGIRQYDLTSSSSDLGRTTIADLYDVQTFQLGPDSQIYITSVDYPDYLFAIKQPNKLNNGNNNACEFTTDYVKLNSNGFGGTANIGLPQFVNAVHPDTVKPDFTYIVSNCRNVRFILNQCCLNDQVTWTFGDGTTGTGIDTIRNYTAGGKYKVVMKWGVPGDSAVHEIKLYNDTSDFTIFGDTVVCDSSVFNTYQTAEHKNSISYTWSASGTSSLSPYLNTADAKWSSNGSIKLKIFDTKNGCRDSSTMNVRINNSLANNVIDSTQNVCDTSQMQLMHGSTPTGGNGTYTYQWYYRATGTTTWKLLTGATGINATPLKKDTSFQYFRIVFSNGCQLPSNIIVVHTLKDYRNLQKGGTCNGKLYVKDRPLAGVSGYSIQWQQSTDSITWTNVTGATGDTLTVNTTVLRKWYRQRVIHGSCTVYSPAVSKGDMIITLQPLDGVACKSMRFVLYSKATSTVGHNIQYAWDYYNNNTNAWTSYPGATKDSFSDYATSFNPIGMYRVHFTSYCGQALSSVATIGKVANPIIITQNNDTTVSSGNSHRLKGKWAGERNVSYAIWQRSKNPVGATWDSIGMTLQDSFNITPTFTACQQKFYYRIVLRNLCPMSGNYKDIFPIKPPIEVGAYQNTGSYTDLWIPDSWRDNGTEPNWIDSQNYTSSHRLWNRNWSDKYKQVKDWKDRVDLQTDRDTNFIHVLVYNRGNSAATDAKVYLYWTLMSVNEDWPYSWTGLAKFTNKDTNSAYYNQAFPLGGRINKTALNLSTFLNQAPALDSHAAYNGQLQAGDSVLITYPWVQADTVPKPEWYYGIINSQYRYANRLGMCLLARVVECDSANFGLSYPEKLNYSNGNPSNKTTYKSNIGYNITRNNNIVSENFYLAYMSPPFSDTIQTWTLGSVKKEDENNDDSVGTRDLKFTFCTDDPTYYNHGEVVLTLPDEYFDLLAAQNYPGTGFNLISASNQLVIYSPCAEIGPITVQDTFSTLLGFSWRYLPGANQLGAQISTLFTLKEFNEDELIGITQYGLKSYQNAGGGGGQQGGGGDAPAMEDQAGTDNPQEDALQKLLVSPNPFNQYLDVRYHGSPNSLVRIEMLDASGKLVKVICQCKADDKGIVSIRTETTNLAQGNYTVRALENGIISAEKVIRCE